MRPSAVTEISEPIERAPAQASQPNGFGRGFLAAPELFPAETAGTPWGAETLTVRFATETLVFSGLSPAQQARLSDRFGPFCRPPQSSPEAIEIRVFRAQESDFLALDPRVCETSLEVEHRPGRLRLAGLSLIGLLGWSASPRVRGGSRLGGALWLPPCEDRFLFMAFENYFRALVAYRMSELGGALVHSAAVVKNGRTHVFFGHSGAGKSTLSRLGAGAGLAVLSDDFNALWPLGEEVMVCQLPFAGDFGRTFFRTDAYPLEGLYQLLQGPTSRLQPVRPIQVVAGLLACCPYVNGDPEWRETAVSNLARIAGRARTGALTAALSPHLWNLL